MARSEPRKLYKMKNLIFFFRNFCFIASPASHKELEAEGRWCLPVLCRHLEHEHPKFLQNVINHLSFASNPILYRRLENRPGKIWNIVIFSHIFVTWGSTKRKSVVTSHIVQSCAPGTNLNIMLFCPVIGCLGCSALWLVQHCQAAPSRP